MSDTDDKAMERELAISEQRIALACGKAEQLKVELAAEKESRRKSDIAADHWIACAKDLQSKLQTAVEALSAYGAHRSCCEVAIHGTTAVPCDCGFKHAIDQIEKGTE